MAGPRVLVVGPMTPTRRRPPTQPAQAGLWGRAEPLPKPAADRPTVNDLDLIQSVIRTATDPGYVVIGPSERVHVREAEDGPDVRRVPTYEPDAVAQLLDAGHLRIGGHHTVRIGRRDGPARSVLPTKTARSMAARWQALHRIR